MTACPRSLRPLSRRLATSLTGLAFLAPVVAAAALSGAAVSSTAAPVRLRTVAEHGGLTLQGAVTCRSGQAPLVVLNGTGRPGRVVWFVEQVNGRTVRSGTLRANSAGRYHVTTAVPNNRTDHLTLRVAGRTVANVYVPVHCAAPSTASAAGSAGSAFAVTSLSPGQQVPVAPASAASGRGSSSAFAVEHNSNGTVTRWNPCDGAIHFQVNLEHAPAGAFSDVLGALGRVEQATGLVYVYDGTTSAVPTTSAAQPAPLLIAWAAPGTGAGQSDYFASGAAGEGGWRASGSSSDGTTWTWKITSAFVVVDPALNSQLAPGFGAGQTRGALLLHELGHTVGLAHSGSGDEVMYPTLTPSALGAYALGDRSGLAEVGASHGCVAAA